MKKLTRVRSSLLAILIFFSFISLHSQPSHDQLPVFMVWDTQASFEKKTSDEEIERYFKRLTDHHITGMFLRASNEYYKKLSPIAHKAGMQIHAWRPTMIRSDSAFMAAHKDWYAVNKNNASCVDAPPYVGYYRWFCPNEPEVVKYLIDQYVELAKIDGIEGIHLDYIRYCDIFLPVGLQPKYHLVQDHEMPEYDYCYCHRCREGFKKEYGRDPIELSADDSSAQRQWRDWRLQAVVRIVDSIAQNVHGRTGKYVSAAVFPTPAISVTMVRQDWSKFRVDAVCPMLYHNFYNKGVDWIGECVKEGLATMEYKKVLHAGIMVHQLTDPGQFTKAVHSAFVNGAGGVVLFAANALTDEQLNIIRDYRPSGEQLNIIRDSR
ncbi:MAG TPA: putative glycoside hydrolase [Bacteroidota bacterium]|nr:putative glycoside hydrolase [Bacteroidota bacterium]